MLIANKPDSTIIKTITKTKNELMLKTNNGNLKFVIYSPSIIRVVFTHNEDFFQTEGLGIVAAPKEINWDYSEKDYYIELFTNQLKIVICKESLSLSYYDKNNNLLTKEPRHNGKTLSPFDSYKTILDEDSKVEKIETPDGIKDVVLKSKKEFDKKLYHTKVSFEWCEDEALYGLGQQEEGILNLRGTRQYIHQANMKTSVPFIMSTKKYGILFDTYSPIIFNDNEFGSYIYSQAADEINFFFIYGNTFDEVISGYRDITGTAVMLPKWALGYIQSQERFESQQEIIDTAANYRKKDVPLDCIILDWESWEAGKWGQKTFDKSRFPDVKKMMESLHEMGVHFMISIWPTMHHSTENYKEMKDNNCLFQQSEIYNAFDKNARKLYWKQANEGLFTEGIDAWWCDSSEPFTPEWNSPIKPEPDSNFYDFHNTAKTYMDEIYTNAFPLMHAKTMYEGQRNVTDSKRVVNLTRSGYTGQQRYGTILWSGDIAAKWSTLESQIPVGLNMCASGMPYWTLDIGGFFTRKGHMWFWDGDYEDGCNDLGYRELYTRWLQYGTFLPIFRAHGTDTRREIWNFGKNGEMFYDSIVKFINLRYQLLPYIYSLAASVTQNNSTIMRLLAFDFLSDTNVYNIKNQFMFGSSLMICPVTKPMYYNANSSKIENSDKSRSVYLPADTKWYDFWTNEVYDGAQTISASSPIDIIPIYVPAGSIIPMTEIAECAEKSSQTNLTIKIYPGADGDFILYQDENDNYNYEKGEYSTISLKYNDVKSELTIGDRNGEFSGMESKISFTIALVGKETYTAEYDGNSKVIKL